MIEDVIAECHLVSRDSSGSETPATIKIGRPTQSEDCAACPVMVDGIDEKVRMIYGEDTLQALLLAIRFARSLIEIREKQGVKYYVAGKGTFDEASIFDWSGYPIMSQFHVDQTNDESDGP